MYSQNNSSYESSDYSSTEESEQGDQIDNKMFNKNNYINNFDIENNTDETI